MRHGGVRSPFNDASAVGHAADFPSPLAVCSHGTMMGVLNNLPWFRVVGSVLPMLFIRFLRPGADAGRRRPV